MLLKSGEFALKNGGFQDMTSDNRRSSWYLSFPRRARKIAHKDNFFPRCAIFLARRAILIGGGSVEVLKHPIFCK